MHDKAHAAEANCLAARSVLTSVPVQKCMVRRCSHLLVHTIDVVDRKPWSRPTESQCDWCVHADLPIM